MLRASALLNSVSQFDVIEACVTDHDGEIEMVISSDSAFSSMADTQRRPQVATLACRGVSLDTVCGEGLACPTILKVDVEGAELKVLEGAPKLFSTPRTQPRLVMMECFDQNLAVFGTSIEGVINRMASFGYAAYVLVKGRREQFAPKHHNVRYNVFFERAL